MTEYYSPGQLTVIYPFLRREPKWLILGGPADANEAQTAREKWPDIKIVGIEPNDEAREWQLANGWPKGCPLLSRALSDTVMGIGEMVFETGRLRNASLDPEALYGNVDNPDIKRTRVWTTTLDCLDWHYGPFEDAIVWLDIEGSEHKALLGATKLLRRRAVMLWNLEMFSRVEGLMEGIPRIMEEHRYVAVKDWNDSESCRDRIFIRKEDAT